MSNSAIYTVNSAQPALVADAQIPFGSVIRRFGQNLKLDGDALVACGSGYYEVNVDVVFVPSAIGPVTIKLLSGDSEVPGAFDTVYAASANNPVSLHISSPVIRLCGCDCARTLGVQISAAGTLTNMGVRVIKI